MHLLCRSQGSISRYQPDQKEHWVRRLGSKKALHITRGGSIGLDMTKQSQFACRLQLRKQRQVLMGGS